MVKLFVISTDLRNFNRVTFFEKETLERELTKMGHLLRQGGLFSMSLDRFNSLFGLELEAGETAWVDMNCRETEGPCVEVF